MIDCSLNKCESLSGSGASRDKDRAIRGRYSPSLALIRICTIKHRLNTYHFIMCIYLFVSHSELSVIHHPTVQIAPQPRLPMCCPPLFRKELFRKPGISYEVCQKLRRKPGRYTRQHVRDASFEAISFSS